MNPLTITGLLVFLAGAASFFLARAVWDWLADQYETVPAANPLGLRVRRRWYGTRSRVQCRDCAEVYRVADWSDDVTAIPWLLVANTDEDPDDVYWAPVTDFTPHMVRKFRPRLLRTWGPIPSLRLFWYEPAPVYAAASGYGKSNVLREYAAAYLDEHPDSEISIIDGKDAESGTASDTRTYRTELVRDGAGWLLYRDGNLVTRTSRAAIADARQWAAEFIFDRPITWLNGQSCPDDESGYWVAEPWDETAGQP